MTKGQRFLLTPILTLLSFAVLLPHLGVQSLGLDWDYYSALSLIVRSNILHYHRFPLHDPWTAGGLDLLTDPQNHIFSPTLLLDLLFLPDVANVLSILLFGFAGYWGMTQLLRRLGVSPLVALLGGFLFISSSWFGLHFAVGHVTFGPIQLLPWALLAALEWENPRWRLGFVALLAFLILEGAVYGFFFSVFVFATGLFLLPLPSRSSIRPSSLLLLALMFCGLVSVKIIPMAAAIQAQTYDPGLSGMPMPLFLRALFDPIQKLTLSSPGGSVDFFEFGCYFGGVAMALVLSAFRIPSYRRENKVIAWAVVFWIWAATGWGAPFTPWKLFQMVPWINYIHVPSRLFIVAALFFIILLARALETVQSPRVRWAFMGWLLLEVIVVKNIPFADAVARHSKAMETRGLVINTTVEETIGRAEKPGHYFLGNKGTKFTGEPVYRRTQVSYVGRPDYRGEAYFIKGRGQAQLLSYTPGRLAVRFSSTGPAPHVLQVNTNSLAGWKITSGPGRVIANPDHLLTVEASATEGILAVEYRPFYLVPVLLMYFAGLLLFFTLVLYSFTGILWHRH